MHHERHYSIQLVGGAKDSGTRERAAEGSRPAETGRIVDRITGVPRRARLGLWDSKIFSGERGKDGK